MHRSILGGPVVLSLIMATLVLAIFSGHGASTTWTVDDDSGRWADFNNINDAVNASATGDLIRVHSGIYSGPIGLTRSVNLTGNGTDSTIIDGRGTIGILIGRDGCRLHGIKVTNCSIALILDGSSGNTVEDIHFANNLQALRLIGSDSNSFSYCTITNRNMGNVQPSSVEQIDEAIVFGASADQHYGRSTKVKTMPFPTYDDETVDDWMSNRRLPEMDFAIASLGDIISDRRGEDWMDVDTCWEKFASNNADHQGIPYFWTVGNHDMTNFADMQDGNHIRKLMTGLNTTGLPDNDFAFMYNNVLFIGLGQRTALFTLSSFQKEWVGFLTDRYEDHTTVIMSHQAIYQTTGLGDERSSSWSSNDYKVYNDFDWWRSLFDDNPQIKLYMHGHTEKGRDTVVFNRHMETWDDHCTFVLVPSNRQNNRFFSNQKWWSYIFSITESSIEVQLWDSLKGDYRTSRNAGVPYIRNGMSNNVTPTGMEWFMVPKQVMDGELWTWPNNFLSEAYYIEAGGSAVVELLDNSEFDGCFETDEVGGNKMAYFYAVDGEEKALNLGTGEEDGFIRVHGNTTLELAIAPTELMDHIEGKAPWNTGIAVPGGEYEFSCKVSAIGSGGELDMLVSIPAYLNLTDMVWDEHPLLVNQTVGSKSKVYSAKFTVPDDEDCWFIQPKLDLTGNVTFTIDSWSLKRVGIGKETGQIDLNLNGADFIVPGPLGPGEMKKFRIDPTAMRHGLDLNARVAGNRMCRVHLIYERPLLWSDDATFKPMDMNQRSVELRDRSPFNNRTTIMSFEGSDIGLEGFDVEWTRGKSTFVNPIKDYDINDVYVIDRLTTIEGIVLRDSSSNIFRSIVVGFVHTSLRLTNSDDNVFQRCNIGSNRLSTAELDGSDSNEFYLNVFKNVEFDLKGSNHDRWDNGRVGNKWSNYEFADADGDGIGEVPYLIDQDTGAKDRFPLESRTASLSVDIEFSQETGLDGNEVLILIYIEQSFYWDQGQVSIFIDEKMIDELSVRVENGSTTIVHGIRSGPGEHTVRIEVETMLVADDSAELTIHAKADRELTTANGGPAPMIIASMGLALVMVLSKRRK